MSSVSISDARAEPFGPVLGLELLPDVAKRPDARVRRST
jgi:hypothetical protein